MVEKWTHYPEDQQIAAALAKELDGVAPRRDLWPSIQAEVQRRQRNHRKWWQLPPFGPLFMLDGQAPALRLIGVSLGSVAVVLLLAWLVLLPPGQNLSQDLLARNVRGYWYDYTSGPVAGSGSVSYAAFFNNTGDNPVIDTKHNIFCSFGVDVDTLSYAEALDLVLNSGRLPDPASVRLEGFINSFDHGYQPPAEGPFAIHIEAAPSPFGGENQWLLRVGLQARTAGAADSPGVPPVIARNVKAQVEFNPQVVSSYRQLGYEYQRVPSDDFPTSAMIAEEVRAGHSVTALFEVSFREGLGEGLREGAQVRVATVHAEYQDPEPGAQQELIHEFNSPDLGLTFEQATPFFQRDAAVAEYAEVLRGSHWAQDSGLEEVRALAQRVSALLPDDPAVAEFSELVSRAEQVAAKNDS